MTPGGKEGTPSSSPSPAKGDTAAEPDSRQVIDTALARVAEIESGAVEESRQLILRSLQDEREAFTSALNRSSRLTSTVEVLAGTVGEMTSALRTQLDDVIEALRALREGAEDPQEQGVVARPEAEAEPQAAPDMHPVEAAPSPERTPDATAPHPQVEPSAELTEMFRRHITRMRDDGKPREEAERALLRFKLGHRFVEMLDEVYSSDATSADAGRHG